MKKTWFVLPFVLSAAVSSTAMSDESASLSKEELAGKLQGVAVEDITESPLEGVYQVSVGSNVAYITANGRYLIQGEVYDLATSQNLTETTRARTRVDLLGGVEREEMIVFSPASGDVKHTITVFTDIDCGYCRQFHREIEQVNDLGIEVHYLFYPRTGPDTESWTKADKVWCASDKNTALTRAKLGGSVPESECAGTPVGEHYDLGNRVGVRGTPAVFAENGELLGGYLPPDALAERLETLTQ